MGSLPVLKPREIVARLEQVRHADGRATTVPFHAGRDISPILLRQICRDIGVAPESFLAS
jgi:predicted RNA binding protein YcfA (HicA-like mRNA interferase family)